MSGVDSRIVTMKFDNAQFESGAKTTISTLDKLKQSLNLPGATKGLQDVQKAVDNVNVSHIQGGITKVSAGFIALTTVAVTALSTITQKAMAAGTNLIKSLTLKPVMDGFREYELKMGSIQTILANTARYGTKLKEVNGALDDLNEYADKTIYNFGEMTRAVGLFTNSGMRLEDATTAIKGFSNVAAASGTTADGAARAQYQLSQAMSTGIVRLMDWKSLTNVGMGNKNMQTSLIEIADAMGSFEGKSIDAKGAADNFNASLEKEWLTKDVMQKYLAIMANEVTPAQMKAMGLTDAQIKKLVQEAKTAEEAATKVRTLTQLFNTVKESIGSGWAETFGVVIGNFNEATKLFTDINDAVSGFFSKSAKARNDMLREWKELGGRDALISGLKSAFEALFAIIKPIKEAFRDIFPPMTAKNLYDLTVKFKEFADKLKINDDTAKALHDTFKGVFAIFSIAKQIISGVIGVFFDLVGSVGKSSGGFLDITAKIGNFISGIDQTLKQGEGLKIFFDVLSNILQTPIKLLTGLGDLIINLFRGFDSGKQDAAVAVFTRFAESLNPTPSLLDKIRQFLYMVEVRFEALQSKLEPFTNMLSLAFDKFKLVMGDIWNYISKTLSQAEFNTVLDTVNTGLFAGLLLLVRKFINDFSLDFGGGFMSSIKDSFEALTGTLSAMQANIKADTLLKIAGAVGLLTISIVALSMIDSKKLMVAMVGVGVAMGELLGALSIMTKITTIADTAKLIGISIGLGILSGALLLLSTAITKLSHLSWSELAKGLVGVGAGLVIFYGALRTLPLAESAGMITAGLGLLSLSLGLKVLASAVGDFASYSLGDLAKGLIATAAGLGIIIGAMKLMPEDLPLLALGLLAVSISLKIIANSIGDLGKMPLDQLLTGMIGIAGALGLLFGAIKLIPPTMVADAAGIALMAATIAILGHTVKKLSGLSWEEVAKGLIAMAGALTIMGFAMKFISANPETTIAIAAMAGSLVLLSIALTMLGALSLGEIAIALGALVATFTVLGVAAALLAPVAPVIFTLASSLALLGASVALVGIGLAGAGLGLKWFAEGLQILVNLGSAVLTTMNNLFQAIIQAIPGLMAAFGKGIVSFTVALAESAPEFFTAAGKLITTMLDAIREKMPKIVETMFDFVVKMLDALEQRMPEIIDKGYKILKHLLRGISENIEEVAGLATEIITKFIKTIGDNGPDIADEGMKTIIKLMNGMADAIRENTKDMNEAGANIASAILEGLLDGLKVGFEPVLTFVGDLGTSIINKIKDVLGIQSPSKEFAEIGEMTSLGLAQGLMDASDVPLSAAAELGSAMAGTIRNQLENMAIDMSGTTISYPGSDGGNSSYEYGYESDYEFDVSDLQEKARKKAEIAKQKEQERLDKFRSKKNSEIQDIQNSTLSDAEKKTRIKNIERTIRNEELRSKKKIESINRVLETELARIEQRRQNHDDTDRVDDLMEQEQSEQEKLLKKYQKLKEENEDLIASLTQLLSTLSPTIRKLKTNPDGTQTYVDYINPDYEMTKKRIKFLEDRRQKLDSDYQKEKEKLDSQSGTSTTQASTRSLSNGKSVGTNQVFPETISKLADSYSSDLDLISTNFMDTNQQNAQNNSDLVSSFASAESRLKEIITNQLTLEQTLGKMVKELATSNELPRTLSFEQNNYSPSSVDEVEVYRQTHNILANAAKELA